MADETPTPPVQEKETSLPTNGLEALKVVPRPDELPAPEAGDGLLSSTLSEMDQWRLRRLNRMRVWATGLLVFMAVVFVVAQYFESQGAPLWVGYVRAFAEAALVGALADWFAVTALFRHPLGLKIPHTAIVVRKQEKIADNLGRFVQNNFLSKAVIARRLEALDAATMVENWLREEKNQQLLADKMTSMLPELISAVPDEQAKAFVSESIKSQAEGVAMAPLAARILTFLTEDGRHHKLFDEVMKFAARAFKENQADLQAGIKKGTPWYVPGFIDKQLYEKVVASINQTLSEVMGDMEHPLRKRFHVAVHEFIDKLQNTDDYNERLEKAKTDLLAHPETQRQLESLWTLVKKRLLNDLREPDGEVRQRVIQLLDHIEEKTLADSDVRARLNAWVRQTIGELAESQQEVVGKLIADTIRGWDRKTIIEKLELQVGRDLQFIRMNGTLVGGAVGLVIHTVLHLLGG